MVSELLDNKGGDVSTVAPETTVHRAVSRMLMAGIGSLVVEEEGRVVGIFTERDCARKVILEQRDPASTSVREAMNAQVVYVTPQSTVEFCLSRMTQTRSRHLVVIEHGRMVGLISIGDCTAHLIRETTQENRHLRDYIGGPYPA